MGHPNYKKLKANLQLSISRFKLLEKKKTELALKSRKEIADYIAAGKEDRARIRVEHIIREDYYVESMEIIEMYCDLLLARFAMIEKMKELDPGLEEAVCSVLWATPRMSTDVHELTEVSKQFVEKYGKEFCMACRENKLENVNQKVLHKMSIQAPPKKLVENYMIEIAKIYGVPFEPDFAVLHDAIPETNDLVSLTNLVPPTNKLSGGSGGPGGPGVGGPGGPGGPGVGGPGVGGPGVGGPGTFGGPGAGVPKSGGPGAFSGPGVGSPGGKGGIGGAGGGAKGSGGGGASGGGGQEVGSSPDEKKHLAKAAEAGMSQSLPQPSGPPPLPSHPPNFYSQPGDEDDQLPTYDEAVSTFPSPPPMQTKVQVDDILPDVPLPPDVSCTTGGSAQVPSIDPGYDDLEKRFAALKKK